MNRQQGRGVLAAIGLALVVAGLPQLASADVDQPPVTVPDEVTLLPGGSHEVDVLANDGDDLGQQALCRARGDQDVQASVDRGRVFVNVSTSDPGDYQVTYQACDFDFLTVGTLTVHAVAPVPVTVHRTDQPGVLHAVNPNPVRVVLGWWKSGAQRLGGRFSLKPGSSHDFAVDAHHIRWFAIDPSSYGEDASIVGYGQVRHIALPDSPPTGTGPSGRLERVWHHHRGSLSAERSPYVPPARADQPWPTDPTTVQPPEPRVDTVHWWSGSWDRVNVTKNDVDPQGQDIDVCRLAPQADTPTVRSGLIPSVIDGQLDVGTRRHAVGTWELPYYVCNSGRLAPALLRVVLVQAKPLQVRRLARDRYLVRVHNPNPQGVWFELGRPHYDIVTARLAAHATTVVRLPLNAHRWQARIGSHGGYAGSGRIATG